MFLLLSGFLAVGALFINPVQTTYGLKSDEATYVSMTLSLAHDGDLTFEEHDLERFWPLYQSGPEGIFLKRGKGTEDHLYFGKSFIYPLVATPFFILAGLNGLLLLNVLLLASLGFCLYLFAATRMTPFHAVLVSSGFLVASIAPLFGVWMMPETFNLAMVGYAYFFWLYKEVRPSDENSTAATNSPTGISTDVIGAVLLGLATFSKPSNVLLILPLIGLAWWRGQFRRGLANGVVFALVVATGFGINALVSGEFNYQGGDRKTFYGQFPFQSDDVTFDTAGIAVTTETVEFEGWDHLGRNMPYFLFGRHFGLIPYYFPAIVILIWILLRRRELVVWQVLIIGTVTLTAMALLIFLPNTWSGGGGPPGNRYFLSIYPALFFLIPTARTILPALAMWCGGALFVAQILVNPFVAAKRPWENTQNGLFRLLPIELTMVNDLPVQLDQGRARISYGNDPPLLLYYLDNNVWRPEEPGIWVAGDARADIIIRTDPPVTGLEVSVQSPIKNAATISLDGSTYHLDLGPNEIKTLDIPVTGVLARDVQNFVLTVETQTGFVPTLRNAKSDDKRFLGVLIGLKKRYDSRPP